MSLSQTLNQFAQNLGRYRALRFWNNDGDALAPSETGGPREVTIQSRIHSNDEQLL